MKACFNTNNAYIYNKMRTSYKVYITIFIATDNAVINNDNSNGPN